MSEKIEGLPAAELQVMVGAAGFPRFLQLLQQGIILWREVGCSVRSFLHDQLRLSPQFVEENIQTIFLDGKPVDDLDRARVKDGCTIALSAAMPGLVGATMRRGGYYASLRAQISHRQEGENGGETAKGRVTLKLFNLVARSLGKTFLEGGFFVTRKTLEDFIRWSQPMGDIQAVLGGAPFDWKAFQAGKSADELVRLRLKIV
ncbi:MAG: hypothetical protein P4L43_12625 [Syntrophobacteraceae bacterium]|nr:hypothetical protein [Syntrophobacteraceae bacterium]